MPEALNDEGPSLLSEVENEGMAGALGGAAFLAPAFGGALTLAGCEASSSARRRSRSALRAAGDESEVSCEETGRCCRASERGVRERERDAPRAASAASALDSFAGLPFAPCPHFSASCCSFSWATFAFLPCSCSSLRACCGEVGQLESGDEGAVEGRTFAAVAFAFCFG